MTDHDQTPDAPLPPDYLEAVEDVRRAAGELSAHRLDEELAVAVARRDVATAHGLSRAATRAQALVLALADVREVRAQMTREVETLTGPPPPVAVRPLTPDELAEVRFEDETGESS